MSERGFNPLGTSICFDIQWLSGAQYYFAKRGIGQDWDNFTKDLYEYIMEQTEEILNSTCPCPYPVVGIFPSTSSGGRLSIDIDLNAVDSSEVDTVIEKVHKFAQLFENTLDLSKFSIPSVDDGVAYINGEIFVKYTDRDADLTNFYLIYEDGKTADNIKDELKG